MLQGQKILGLSLRAAPAAGEFVFDLGGKVAYRWKDATETGDLWTFNTCIGVDDVDIISFTASATVILFTRRGALQRTAEFPCEREWLPVHPNAAPNSHPPSQLRAPPEIQWPDSQRTPSSGG